MERQVQTTSPKNKKSWKSISAWTPKFSNLLKLSRKEKQLNPNVTVSCKRPQTLSTLLTNYKILAHKSDVGKGVSCSYGKYMLCARSKAGEMIKKQIILNKILERYEIKKTVKL